MIENILIRDMVNFSERLNDLLKTASQKDISEKTGLSQSSISMYASGKRKPASDAIIKIANYFDVSTDYLLGLTENPSRSGKASEFMLSVQNKAEKYDELRKKLQRLASEFDDE